MKKFICRKPIKFGKNYVIGEEIPAEEISENRVPALLKYGIIEAVETPDVPVAKAEDKPIQAAGRKKAAK